MTFRTGVRPDIAVLADDLTSAGDGAAPFRRAGHEARILFGVPEAPPERATGVTAVDLGSRMRDEEAAAARTERAARLFAGVGLLLKTVDSTLRGHVAAEVRAAWAGSRRRAVVVAPAFPAEGRVTVEGVQSVHGVPVHASDFARDPVHPVRCSDLTELFPEAVPAGPDEAAGLPGLVDDGRLVVWSARTDGDLDRLVAAVPRLADVLWVGSPGLAAALARRCVREEDGAPGVPEPALRPLVVVGSAHPVSRRQLAVLRRRADVRAAVVDGDRGAAERAVAALRGSPAPVLALHTPDERHAPSAAGVLAGSVAAAVRALAGGRAVDALVLTGGETASTAFRALGATGIRLADEPEPGVARGTLLGPLPLPVLVKAGGFGDDATLLRLSQLARQPLGSPLLPRHRRSHGRPPDRPRESPPDRPSVGRRERPLGLPHDRPLVRPLDDRPFDNRPFNDRPSNGRLFDDRLFNDRLFDDRPLDPGACA
ncbi:four-carbon acid sugar kinase family protein [Streptomyces omiyaensis]|uniref:four-carbon acid sugar kinase family protein n=1 Tax=Streptomyces omiyaensis TaxID=68247 RepID=UPI003700C517